MSADTFADGSPDRLDAPDTVGVWCDGDLMVIERGAALPRRCIVTNEPLAGFVMTRLNWHHPAWYVALVFVPGIYVIYLLMFASNVEATFGLSRRLLNRRRLAVVGASITFSLGLLASCFGGGIASTALALAGAVLMLAALVWWVLGTRLPRLVRFESGYGWIKGVHPGAMIGLPAWAGPPNKRIEQNARR